MTNMAEFQKAIGLKNATEKEWLIKKLNRNASEDNEAFIVLNYVSEDQKSETNCRNE